MNEIERKFREKLEFLSLKNFYGRKIFIDLQLILVFKFCIGQPRKRKEDIINTKKIVCSFVIILYSPPRKTNND